MKNYICINGNKTELTDEQVRTLGFPVGGYSIAELSEIVRSGKARECLSIHDTVNFGGYELEVIGIDHDKAVDDDTLPTITLMAKTLLPARRMHGGANERGWIDSELRAYLQNDFINQLPPELVEHIQAVNKLTHTYNGEPIMTVDTLFIPSESELFGSAIWAAREDGARYEAFATSSDRLRLDGDGDSDWYWTRSPRGGRSTYCAYVSGGGRATSAWAGNGTRAPLCFCFA